MTNKNNRALEEELSKQIYLPTILLEIINLFKIIHPNVPERVALNLLISKVAHMVTCKRITFDESGVINIPNWYSMIFMPSGSGKDIIVRDFDKFIFAKFLEWYNQQALELYTTQMKIYEMEISSKPVSKLENNSKNKEKNYDKEANPF